MAAARALLFPTFVLLLHILIVWPFSIHGPNFSGRGLSCTRNAESGAPSQRTGHHIIRQTAVDKNGITTEITAPLNSKESYVLTNTTAKPYLRDVLLKTPKVKRKRRLKHPPDLSAGAGGLSARQPGQLPFVVGGLWRRVVLPQWRAWVPTVRWGFVLAPRLEAVVRLLPNPALVGLGALCANELTQRAVAQQIEQLPTESARAGAREVAAEALGNLGDRLDYLMQKGWQLDALFLKEMAQWEGGAPSPEAQAFLRRLAEAQMLQVAASFHLDENITSVLVANSTEARFQELQKVVPEEYKSRLLELGKLVKKIEGGKEPIGLDDVFSVFVEKEKLASTLLGFEEPAKLLKDLTETVEIFKTLEVEFSPEAISLTSTAAPERKVPITSFFEQLLEPVTTTLKDIEASVKQAVEQTLDDLVPLHYYEDAVPPSNAVSLEAWFAQLDALSRQRFLLESGLGNDPALAALLLAGTAAVPPAAAPAASAAPPLRASVLGVDELASLQEGAAVGGGAVGAGQQGGGGGGLMGGVGMPEGGARKGAKARFGVEERGGFVKRSPFAGSTGGDDGSSPTLQHQGDKERGRRHPEKKMYTTWSPWKFGPGSRKKKRENNEGV